MRKIRGLHFAVITVFALTLVACSDYRQAHRAYAVGKYQEAFEILERLAQAGDSKAQYDIALMYLQGIGTQQNPQQGGYWMMQSAESGNVTAMVEIGGRYEHGVNTDQNLMAAFSWYRRAANAGDRIGRYRLALLYETGKGVPQDYIRAYAWYDLADDTAGRLAKNRLEQVLSAAERDKAKQLAKELAKNPDY